MSHSLPQLRVASPCPKTWESMDGDHRTRFCDECKLHVHNVSAMTRSEARALFQSSNGRLCLNGFARPDGELVTQESLAELLELHGAAPERVAAVRAALAAGLTAVALSLAACTESEPPVLGALRVEPPQQIEQPPAAPAAPPTTQEHVSLPQPQHSRPRVLTGGAPASIQHASPQPGPVSPR